jgi:NAD(P)-dependent dehydrogenase (short-subunit alcohol dehydrogenase family)
MEGFSLNSGQKVVVVTGASRGIGAELVRGFRGIGYGVVANSRSIKSSDVEDDPAILLVEGDIAMPETADRVVSEAIRQFGRIDTLINNAGIFIPKPFTDYSEADFVMTTAVNLAGFFHISQRAASRMLQAGSGHIVNITASIGEHSVASVPTALTALTKGGLIAVTRSLAIEYAGRGIRVNAVSPGAIKTPMNPPGMHEFLAGLHPMGRMGEIHEIVEAVLYLERAAFVTGEILHVDGGACAGKW